MTPPKKTARYRYRPIQAKDIDSINEHLNAGWEIYQIGAAEQTDGVVMMRKKFDESSLPLETYDVVGVPVRCVSSKFSLRFIKDVRKGLVNEWVLNDILGKLYRNKTGTNASYSDGTEITDTDSYAKGAYSAIEYLSNYIRDLNNSVSKNADLIFNGMSGGKDVFSRYRDQSEASYFSNDVWYDPLLRLSPLAYFGVGTNWTIVDPKESKYLKEHLKDLKTYKTGLLSKKEAMDYFTLLDKIGDADFIVFATTSEKL